MTPRIYLHRDPGALSLPVGEGGLCVTAKGYRAPRTLPGCRHAAWPIERTDLDGVSTLVLVGLSKIITPANRTPISPIVLDPHPGLQRITVDRALFVSEPWRAWFAFGAVGAEYDGYTYSYLAESHWRAAQDGKRERDPFSAEALARWGRGVVAAVDPWRIDLRETVVPVPDDMRSAYQDAKAAAFDEEHTEHALLKRLGSWVQARMPERRMPAPADLWRTERVDVVRTDLAVDRYLTDRLLRLAALTNHVADTFCTDAGVAA